MTNRKKYIRALFLALLLSGVAPRASTAAETSGAPEGMVLSSSLAAQLGRHAQEIGVGIGFGAGMSRFGSTQAHDFALVRLNWGRVLTDTLAEESWFAGSLEFVGEISSGYQIRPTDASLMALTPLLRYNFNPGGKWIPFVDTGIGVMATDIGRPDLSTGFQFNDTAGVGIHWFFGSGSAVTVQHRFTHISNGGIHKPNNGVNSNHLWVGFSRFF